MFSGEDVARVLGYAVFADALRKVDAEDKFDNTLINEFGLFTLISLGTDKEFKRFATREMLPQYIEGDSAYRKQNNLQIERSMKGCTNSQAVRD